MIGEKRECNGRWVQLEKTYAEEETQQGKGLQKLRSQMKSVIIRNQRNFDSEVIMFDWLSIVVCETGNKID